jgi:hypothetical protein
MHHPAPPAHPAAPRNGTFQAAVAGAVGPQIFSEKVVAQVFDPEQKMDKMGKRMDP